MGFDFPICLFCFLPAFQGGFQNGPPRWFRSAGARVFAISALSPPPLAFRLPTL